MPDETIPRKRFEAKCQYGSRPEGEAVRTERTRRYPGQDEGAPTGAARPDETNPSPTRALDGTDPTVTWVRSRVAAAESTTTRPTVALAAQWPASRTACT